MMDDVIFFSMIRKYGIENKRLNNSQRIYLSNNSFCKSNLHLYLRVNGTTE